MSFPINNVVAVPILVGVSINDLIVSVPKPNSSGRKIPVKPQIIPAIIGKKKTGICLGIFKGPVSPFIYTDPTKPAKTPNIPKRKIS